MQNELRVYLYLFYSDMIFFFHDDQIQESNEARQKFSNAKSISSAQFFGDQNKASDAQISLEKFTVCAHAFITKVCYIKCL